MDAVNLEAPDYYLNRELSFLEFNQRVLDLAQDPDVPLLERVKFLSISCSNLDEFFEIRVAGLKERLELGSHQRGPDGRSIAEQLEAIHLRARALVADQYRLLNDVLVPALFDAGIHLVRQHRLTDEQLRALEPYFENEVEPVLSPLALDPARPFPKIQNKSLNFVVKLQGHDAFGRETSLAVVQVPRSLPRVVRIPPTDGDGGLLQVAYLSTIVQRFVHRLFEGVTVEGCWQFRVTRNSDLFVDEEEVEDLRRAVEGELAQRRYGDEVRLETAHDCPPEIVGFLLHQFQLGPTDLYPVHGPVNLNRLMAVYELVDRPELKYPAFTPGVPERLVGRDLFAAIREKDVLLHHPFQSFAPVVDLVRLAARDPNVLAIKQTLYRSGPDSAIVDALVDAARNGKDVTVIVELMARFDEAANIVLATRLQEAGAHVMYGVVGYKTHAKLLMVVRREEGGLRRYCHVGTGNYHARTARTYTDYGLLTCDEAIGHDLHDIFLELTSLTRVPKLRRLLQSPFTLHDALLAKIGREAANARAGRPARIVAKMNSLLEQRVIAALYAASNAGVEIDLIVRGICALRPGIPGVSERIRVRSIVGRMLEHSRVFHFLNDGAEPEVWCASADWMDRNFFRRVEVAFPLTDPRHRQRILRDLEAYLADNTNAWVLSPDGAYERTTPGAARPFSSQQALLQRHAEA
jgi:polyphosphate kinase